jgi:hypothetical protein
MMRGQVYSRILRTTKQVGLRGSCEIEVRQLLGGRGRLVAKSSFHQAIFPMFSEFGEDVGFHCKIQLVDDRPMICRSDHGQTLQHCRIQDVLSVASSQGHSPLPRREPLTMNTGNLPPSSSATCLSPSSRSRPRNSLCNWHPTTVLCASHSRNRPSEVHCRFCQEVRHLRRCP